MTWITFTRDYRHSNQRYTEYFEKGERRNLPRALADKIHDAGAGVKEERIAKQRKDKTPVSEASSG